MNCFRKNRPHQRGTSTVARRGRHSEPRRRRSSRSARMESTQGATGLMFGLETSRPRGCVARGPRPARRVGAPRASSSSTSLIRVPLRRRRPDDAPSLPPDPRPRAAAPSRSRRRRTTPRRRPR
eukprot:31517-Pelagococcus_subviridis.AAC.6